MKIAQFRKQLTATHSYDLIVDEKTATLGTYGASNGYTRISEWAEVEFHSRDPREIVPEQLATLDAAEHELRAKFQLKLTELAEQRAKLLALTHQASEGVPF